MVNSRYRNDIGSANTSPAQFEMWMREISNLINTKPLTVIQTIELTTHKKFIGTTYGDLARAVGELLKVSPKFRAAMAVLVHLNNGLVNYDQIASGDYMALIYSGGGQQAKSLYKGASDPLTGILEVVSGAENLSASIANATSAVKVAKTNAAANEDIVSKQQSIAETNADAAIKTELMRTVQAKIGANGAVAGASSANAAGGSNTLLIAVVVLMGLGGVYLLSRSSQKDSVVAVPLKAAGGGMNPPVPPTPPIATVPPAAVPPVATPPIVGAPGAPIPGVDDIKF